MSFKEFIKQRRTVYQFLEKPLSLNLVDSFIECAITAPNHKLTQPWQFWVIGEQSQVKLAKIYAEKRALKNNEVGSESYLIAYEKSFKKFISIPKIVLVGQLLDIDLVVRKEDYAACCCAIQNFQLAAWEDGIGVQWSTGPILEDDRTYKLLDIHLEKIELIAALYMGHPKAIGQSERKHFKEVTNYLP